MKINPNEFLWVEKYRPQTIDDIILPKDFKNSLRDMVSKKQIQNLLLASEPGLGKGSLVNVLMHELKFETLFINGSLDTGIDVMRNKVSNFTSMQSLMGTKKLVFIDEMDRISTAGQDALKAEIEIHSKHVSFIFTTNRIESLIKPNIDRLVTIDFDVLFQKHKKEIVGEIYKRLINILNNENIKFDKKDVVEVIKHSFPSIRKMIGFLQYNIKDGKLDISNLENKTQLLDEFVNVYAKKDIKLIYDYLDEFDLFQGFYNFMYNNMTKFFDDNDIPPVIIDLAKYQEYTKNAINKKIPILAFFASLFQQEIYLKNTK